VYQYSSSAANKSVIVLPEFSNINAGTHRLRFKARGSTALAIMEVGYVTNPTDINSFVLVESININNTSYTATNAERSVYFPTNVPTNSRIAIRNNGTNTASIYWDDVNWELAPACASPSATYTTAVTQNAATLNWTAPLTVPGAGYEYFYSTTNTAPTIATTPSGPASATSVVLNSLTPNTKYYYWVRSVCATNNYSVWSPTDSFFTGHCIPQGLTTNTTTYLSNIYTSGATQNINYTGTAPIGYVDSSTQILQTFPTNVIQYNISNNSNVANNYYIWVDWNNDLDFDDAGETILATTNWPALASGSLTMVEYYR
jgi:hypothetical protein